MLSFAASWFCFTLAILLDSTAGTLPHSNETDSTLANSTLPSSLTFEEIWHSGLRHLQTACPRIQILTIAAQPLYGPSFAAIDFRAVWMAGYDPLTQQVLTMYNIAGSQLWSLIRYIGDPDLGPYLPFSERQINYDLSDIFERAHRDTRTATWKRIYMVQFSDPPTRKQEPFYLLLDDPTSTNPKWWLYGAILGFPASPPEPRPPLPRAFDEWLSSSDGKLD